MSTWNGWIQQLEKALGVPDTSELGYLFQTWASEVKNTCGSNPLVASRPASGSSNCKTLPGGKHAQNYASHASGIAATAAQIKSGNYPHLWAAISSGNPYNVSNPQSVADDLTKWGAPGAGLAYTIEVQNGSFGSGVPAGVKAAHLHNGWADIRHSVNKNMPTALSNANRSLDAGLRAVARARKVRL